MRIKLIFFIVLLSLLASGQTGARYLIITHDSFYNDVLPLAEWKYQKGMKSKVVKLSETGSSASQIRTYIQNAYNGWEIIPEFILLVGAPNYVPFPTVYGEYSDNYYTNMNGDIFNEILSGRLTVHSNYEAQTVINKILAYEKDPDVSDSLWFKKATLIVNIDNDPPDDSIYWSDAHFAAACMVNAGFVDIDTLSDLYGHNAQSVINSVNGGRSIVMYRGSGVNNWGSPFNVDPGQTQNGKKLPIVISTTCRTIGTGSTAAAAEMWLLTGTPLVCRGGAGYFATTTVVVGQAYLRSAVAKGFHDGLFNQSMRTFGQACENGRKNVYYMWQYQGGTEEYVGFTTLGDPEMNIWTDTPAPLLVEHPPFAIYGPCSLQIAAQYESDTTPAGHALVCLSGVQDSSVYAYDYTDSSGEVRLFINPMIIEDTIIITVTGFNLKPWQGRIPVLPCESYIVFSRAVINDSAGGNNDGMINPGEAIEMPVWVDNLGDSTAVDVTGILRTSDPYIAITDSIRSFGDIAGHDSGYTGGDGFNFSVPFSVSDQHQINFELFCSDINDSSWISSFNQVIYSSNLGLNGIVTYDGNNNGIIEPAETVQVIVTLYNHGHAPADDVNGVFRSEEEVITLIDTTAVYGHIGVDSSQQNTSEPFKFVVDDSASNGTIFQARLVVSSNYFTDSFDIIFAIGSKHYYLWNPDPTPSSGLIIDSLLQSLGYCGDYGTVFPTDLLIYRSLLVCCGIYSTRYLIPQNSAEALAITDYLNDGGRVYLEGSSTWYVDPYYFNGHNFGPMFGINAPTWSYGDLGPVIGQNGKFTQGMTFAYGGENRYMDHLNATGTGFMVLYDQNNAYGCGIANATTNYRTVGVDFELGFLNDASPPSTRTVLLDSIMRFFGMHSPSVSENSRRRISVRPYLYIYPNPSVGDINFCVRYSASGTRENTISVYDVSGRLIRRLDPVTAGQTLYYSWNKKDPTGKSVPPGVYFAAFGNDGDRVKSKFIILKN